MEASEVGEQMEKTEVGFLLSLKWNSLPKNEILSKNKIKTTSLCQKLFGFLNPIHFY